MNEPIYVIQDNATRNESDETKKEKEQMLYYIDETLGQVTFYQKIATVSMKTIHCDGAQLPRDTAGKKIAHYPGMKLIPKEEGAEEVFLTNITKFKP